MNERQKKLITRALRIVQANTELALAQVGDDAPEGEIAKTMADIGEVAFMTRDMLDLLIGATAILDHVDDTERKRTRAKPLSASRVRP